MHVGHQQEKPVHKKCVVCGKEFAGADRMVCEDDGGMLAVVASEPSPGHIFAERYEIIGLIGDGGWGKVYKAQHKLMKRAVAIKVLLPHLVKSHQALKRFQQEARAASSLNHPNVMTVFDFGTTADGLPFLVMDLLEGTSLSAVLQQEQSLSVERSLRIFVQVCEGLAHAHEKGVIHRDIKPNNLMLVSYIGQSDFVKIVDFGIAKLAENEAELTQTGEIFGSPMYMSPEQCRGKELDARSDIYSAGCVLYRCIAGRPAFVGRDAMECMFKQVHEEPSPLGQVCVNSNIPSALEVVVAKALAKEPDDRFQHMIEFRDALIELYRDMVGEIPVTASTQLRLYAVAQATGESAGADCDLSAAEAVSELSALTDSELVIPVTGTTPVSPANTLPSRTPTQDMPAYDGSGCAVSGAHPAVNSDPSAFKAPGLLVPLLCLAALVLGSVLGFAMLPRPEPDKPPITAVEKEDDVAAAMDLARTAFSQGEYETAISKLLEAEKSANKLTDPDKSAQCLLQILPLLGQCYLDVDTPDMAREAYEKVILKQRRAYGEDSLQYVQTETGLGIALAQLGHVEQAQKYLNHAMEVYRQKPEQMQDGLCDVYYGLARVAEAQGDLAAANTYLSEALRKKELQPQPDLETANLMVNIAQLYVLRANRSGAGHGHADYGKARVLMEKAMAIEKSRLGERSTVVAGSMKNLAVICYQQGEREKAEELFKRALEINNNLNSSKSLLAAEIMFAMSIMYANEGRMKEAIPLAGKSLEIRRAMLGANAPQVKKDEALFARMQQQSK